MDATTPPSYTDSSTAVDNSNQGPLCNSPPVDTLNPALPYLPPYYVDEPGDQQGPIPPYTQEPIPPNQQGPPQYNHDTVPRYPRQNFQTPQRPGVYGVSNSQPYAHTVVRASPTEPNYAGIHTFACFMLWCCNPLFGLIAFVLIVSASAKRRSNPEEARRLAKASLIVSNVGLIITVVAVAVIIGIARASSSTYYSTTSTKTCYSYDNYGNRYSYSC